MELSPLAELHFLAYLLSVRSKQQVITRVTYIASQQLSLLAISVINNMLFLLQVQRMPLVSTLCSPCSQTETQKQQLVLLDRSAGRNYKMLKMLSKARTC